MNNENYAEVSRVLGQRETDKQLAFLGKALCEALPQLKDNPNFTSATDNWNRRQNTWPSELIKRIKKRKPPKQTVASISSLNNAHSVYVHQINDQRRAIKDGLLKQVDDQTTRIRNAEQKLHDMQQTNRKQYDEDRIRTGTLFTQSVNGAPNAQVNAELLEVQNKIERASVRNADFERVVQSQIDTAVRNKQTIQKRISHIKYMAQSKGEKHWVITTPDGLNGWVPSENQYVPCFTNKAVTNADLAKLLEVCPFTSTVNLALTIRNYIDHSDSAGWDEKQLMTAILLLLKQQKPDLHVRLNVKRADFYSFFKALVNVCHQTMEVSKCRAYLNQFVRDPTTTFTETMTTFEAVWGHWQQLLRPIRKTELADLSITIMKQITPFLVAEPTAKLYIAWQERQYQYQQQVTKESILEVIQQFEAHSHLQLTEKKRLPQHLGFTQEDPVQIDVQAAGLLPQSSGYKRSEHGTSKEKHKPSHRSSSNDKNPGRKSQDRSRKDYNNKSPGKNSDKRSYSSDKSHTPRQRSSSRQSTQGSAPTSGNHSRNSSVNSAYSKASTKSSDSFPSQMKSLQRHTSHSKSSRAKDEKFKPVSHMYRSKSPGTVENLRTYYFIPGKGHEEFKEWKQLNRCLRCFSPSHQAKDCRTHREPIREPCRLCVYLFHPTERCHIYSLDGTKRRHQKN